MAPVVRQVYDQMPNPKWVISMGACASSGGMFNNYAIVQGCDHFLPVDMYMPGCPPRPDMLIDAMFKLREKVQHRPIGANEVDRHRRGGAGSPGGPRHARDEGTHAMSETQPRADAAGRGRGPHVRAPCSPRQEGMWSARVR